MPVSDQSGGAEMSAHVTVIVGGKPRVISIYQKSKNVWIAAGRYLDEQIQVIESSYNAAIKRWREAAAERLQPAPRKKRAPPKRSGQTN
jgi:hypothetical protein